MLPMVASILVCRNIVGRDETSGNLPSILSISLNNFAHLTNIFYEVAGCCAGRSTWAAHEEQTTQN